MSSSFVPAKRYVTYQISRERLKSPARQKLYEQAGLLCGKSAREQDVDLCGGKGELLERSTDRNAKDRIQRNMTGTFSRGKPDDSNS